MGIMRALIVLVFLMAGSCWAQQSPAPSPSPVVGAAPTPTPTPTPTASTPPPPPLTPTPTTSTQLGPSSPFASPPEQSSASPILRMPLFLPAAFLIFFHFYKL
eukprot:Gb_20945 [translate_table: standard]